MLDIKFIKENEKKVVESLKKRGSKFDVKKLLDLDKKRVESAQLRDEARAKQRTVRDKKEGTKLKEDFQKFDKDATETEKKRDELLISMPNITADEVPTGDEKNNKEIKKSGNVIKFDFKAKDHVELGQALDILDFERGVKVSGSRFYFIKGAGAELARAITSFALDILNKHGFTFVLSPQIVTENMIWGKGLLSKEEIELNVYKIEGEDKYLIGTGEIPLTGLHSGETLDAKSLPLKYSTLTPCYRKEAGTYGKHAKGLFRVHQFEKLEMYQYVVPEKSSEALEEFVKIEEEILNALEIPYRVMLVAAGDMAGYLYKQYDIEYHSPVDNEYREIMSAGNALDFQSRRLNIRYRDKDNKLQFVHTLNATAVPVSRMMIAIMENYQTNDGKITVPKVLKPYMGGREIISS